MICLIPILNKSQGKEKLIQRCITLKTKNVCAVNKEPPQLLTVSYSWINLPDRQVPTHLYLRREVASMC